MEFKYSKNDGVLNIELPEVIDTTNAVEVEDSLIKTIEANSPFTSLVFNADKLTYISSVGLRIMLRVKKENDSLVINEVCNDVYEIFEMTGFTEIIDIKKALRRVSVEGCKVIGEGFYGRVYRISPDTIVKVYFRDSTLADVDREKRLAKTAFVLGVPTAISYDVVKVKEEGKDCYGSVFELLDCSSLKNLILNDVDNLNKYIKMHSDLIEKINSTIVPSKDLPYSLDATKEWLAVIKKENIFDDKTFEQITKLVNTIPNVDNMVHGDCHVKNILVQNGEPLLIDMDTLSKGHRIFELGGIYLCYCAYELTEPGNCLSFLGIQPDICKKIYTGILKNLFSDKSEKELEIIQGKIEYLACVLFLFRQILYSPENQVRRDYCVKVLTEGLKKFDTLDF